MRKITRRQCLDFAVKGTIGASALVGTSWSASVIAALESEATRNRFVYGVASGDPTQTSIIIWTKLNINSNRKEHVRWVVATNPSFTDVVKRGSVTSKTDEDYTVKINVKGLKPGSRYFYKFIHDGIESEPGRTRTLPEGGLEKLSIAIASCSNFPFGYFNAYDAIAKDESVEFVVHLGDYIYEYGPDGYGGEVGKQLGREHIPARETLTLSDYRLRHAQYKSDLSSRLMHATHPLIAIWDDHESANNPYMNGAQNHQEGEGAWTDRRQASLQAYFEWMPVRNPGRGEKMQELWRAFNFGDLATLVTLETRHTGRSKQIEYANHLPKIHTQAERDTFVNKVLGDKSRTMLSSKMTDFLEDKLSESVKANTTWRLVGNQIPMARTHVPPISNDLLASLNIDKSSAVYNEVQRFKKLGELNLPIYTDTWDGYPVAREKFYQSCTNAGATDLIVLTGDSHAYWLNQLIDKSGAPMGYEVGTTGVTSPGDFEYFGTSTAKILDQMLVEGNKEILWTDNVSKGYIRLSLNKKEAQVDYVAVSDILKPSYTTAIIKSVKFSPGTSGNGLSLNSEI